MSRLSYGGGMFSPIRCDDGDASNDVFENQRDSDIFSQWKEICVGEILAKNSEELFVKVNDEKEDNSTFAVKPNDIFACKREKTNSVTSKGKLSYITTRRKSSTQSKQTGPHKEVKKNESLSKYVSVRSEAGNDLRTSKTRQSINFHGTPALPSLSEEQFGMKSLSPEKAFSAGGVALSGAQKLPNNRKEQDISAFLKESTSNGRSLTVECEVQTDLSMNELNLNSAKKLGESSSKSEPPSGSYLCVSSKTQQVQANIIEKLVKDTVSFEFDGIRQMLYLQQLSLFKYMDKNFEIERQNSSLQAKYIEALMEENERLRTEVTAYQNFFKV